VGSPPGRQRYPDLADAVVIGAGDPRAQKSDGAYQDDELRMEPKLTYAGNPHAAVVTRSHSNRKSITNSSLAVVTTPNSLVGHDKKKQQGHSNFV
jgi:hypothetical protein